MSTDYLIYAAIVVTFILMIVFAIKDSLNPYVPAGPLFTKAELNFYRYLTKAVDGKALVFGKVRIADVIQPKESIKGSKRVTALNKIAQKHFDFVLVHPQTMQVLAAVELNDKSHDRKERAERDKLVRDAMKSSDIPLIEVPAGKTYDLVNLFRLIAPSLESLLHPNQPDVQLEIEPERTKPKHEVVPSIKNDVVPATSVKDEPTLLTPEQILLKALADKSPADKAMPQDDEVLKTDLLNNTPIIPKLMTREEIIRLEDEAYVSASDMRIPD